MGDVRFSAERDKVLREAFDKVANKENWKLPVDAVIPEADMAVTTDAVIYFTGSVPEFVKIRRKPGFLRVLADGYYHAIGS